MPGILILRHNQFLLSINQKLVEKFLSSRNIEAEIIAPNDFVALTNQKEGVPFNKFMSTLVGLAKKWPSNICIIFFEANLGFPGQEILDEATTTMLSYLVRKYPEAIFILKSQTEKAVVNAAQLLKEQCIPLKHGGFNFQVQQG